MSPEKHSTVTVQPQATPRHSIAVQILDSVLTTMRKGHEMQQMLNRYR